MRYSLVQLDLVLPLSAEEHFHYLSCECLPFHPDMTRSVTVSSAGPVHGGRQAAGTVYSSSKVKQPVSQQYTDYSNLSKPYSSSKVKQQLFTTRYRCSNLNKRVAQNLCRRKAISLVCLHHTDLKKKLYMVFMILKPFVPC